MRKTKEQLLKEQNELLRQLRDSFEENKHSRIKPFKSSSDGA